MMMVAVAWNLLLPLLLMFLIIWSKVLSNAQICSRSAETVCRVQKCPASQTEWDKAAQRKDCSEMQKYDNCAKVEYHCLVNEFRNETIEVCTVPRYIQGYCPMYSVNRPSNNYVKRCANQTSCNCSTVYLSTEAYKWQCCYSGINNQDVKLFPNKYCRGNTIAAVSDNDENNNVHVEVRLIPLLLIGALVVLVGCSSVCYGMKRQNKTFYEALKIWKICTSLDNTQRATESRENGMNNLETTVRLLEQGEGPAPAAETQVGSSIQLPETPNGDSSNQGMSTSNPQEEIISLDPETPLIDTSPEYVPRPFTPALPNGDSPNQGMPASNTIGEGIISTLNSETPVIDTSADVSRPFLPGSSIGDNSNQEMPASDTPNDDDLQPRTSASHTTEGDISMSDLDLLFDFLSRKISPQDLVIFSVHLLGETQMAETARSQSYPSETYFRILHTWRCKHPSIDHQGKLEEIFHSSGRQDLIDEMKCFSRDQFIFNDSQIVEPEKQVENSDLTTIANNLGSRYYNVMRFLGINQRKIDQIEADYSFIKEQIYQTLLHMKRLKPTLTRQTICNALFYADHSDVIENLNSKWKRGIP